MLTLLLAASSSAGTHWFANGRADLVDFPGSTSHVLAPLAPGDELVQLSAVREVQPRDHCGPLGTLELEAYYRVQMLNREGRRGLIGYVAKAKVAPASVSWGVRRPTLGAVLGSRLEELTPYLRPFPHEQAFVAEWQKRLLEAQTQPDATGVTIARRELASRAPRLTRWNAQGVAADDLLDPYGQHPVFIALQDARAYVDELTQAHEPEAADLRARVDQSCRLLRASLQVPAEVDDACPAVGGIR